MSSRPMRESWSSSEARALKIAIVGTGAMGSVYAALLAAAGNAPVNEAITALVLAKERALSCR